MTLHGQTYEPEVIDLVGARLIVADKGNMGFAGVSGNPYIWTDGSTATDYIPTGSHVLPAGAALPMLDRSDSWACPGPERFAAARTLIEQTSNTGEIVKPGWERMRHLLGLHLGGAQAIPGNDVASFPQTRIEWWRDNWPASLGGTRKRGWYFGTLAGRDGNGDSNWHYGRIWWMTCALVYEEDHAKRQAAWPFYVQQANSYASSGRLWADVPGGSKGQSRDEKGQVYVGDSGRFPYEKDWTLNLIGPWLLTGQEIFHAAIDNAVEFYVGPNGPKWGGAWGSRIPARIIGSMVGLWLVTRDQRLVTAIAARLDEAERFLDRVESLWPNIGNQGKAPESPWMQAELVAETCRAHELMPGMVKHGPSRADLWDVMDRVMEFRRGPEGGSEYVNGHRLLRYRYHTPTNEAMTARFPANTAFALPALRLLGHPLYHEVRDTVKDFAGSSLTDIQAGKPFPIDQIGYRFPREGPAWPKTLLEWLDAIR